MRAYKPTVTSFSLGDLVVERNKLNKREMVVKAVYPDGTYNAKKADYGTVFLSPQGKPVFKDFEQQELKLAK